ncbi:hypothetical protein MSG28_016127 [Choristoneura fumiferana]|uniref:Uncharacterized protein n=1 Tax=Choristoneura fumiferana TaxID=7141 RepID=A0ACC0K5X7_CHOFU|nr:hypothetical protein MSG28_016127 [Choristoneura fumiferana]
MFEKIKLFLFLLLVLELFSFVLQKDKVTKLATLIAAAGPSRVRPALCVNTTNRAAPAADTTRPAPALCNSSFLEQHMRSHTGERPHACPDCALRFNCRGNLKRHQKVVSPGGCIDMPHTGTSLRVPRLRAAVQLPQQPEATSRGGESRGLYRHAPHGGRPHACPDCALRFNCRGNLKRHQKVVSPGGCMLEEHSGITDAPGPTSDGEVRRVRQAARRRVPRHTRQVRAPQAAAETAPPEAAGYVYVVLPQVQPEAPGYIVLPQLHNQKQPLATTVHQKQAST